MLHPFLHSIPASELPSKFTFPFCYTPHPLVVEAARMVQTYIAGRADWQAELDGGKMFGVLIAASPNGEIGFLAAFSGNIAHSNNHPYFVPPVFDLLRPDGFFRQKEVVISQINKEIREAEDAPEIKDLRCAIEDASNKATLEINAFSARIKCAKTQRAEKRAQGASPEEEAVMIRQSQFEKAELRRIKQRHNVAIVRLESLLAAEESRIDAMKRERHRLSAALQRELFDHFQLLNAKGEQKGLCQIFEEARHELPPAGAGECAAPKLLQYAFLHELRPLAMGEFWWGQSPKAEIRRHLSFYPACKSKCEPILNFMLQGMEVDSNPLTDSAATEVRTLYEDDAIWVVDKLPGMPTVQGTSGCISLLAIARQRYPEAPGPLIVHRLVLHTSVIVRIAKDNDSHKKLQEQFESHCVEKTYMAILESMPHRPKTGIIDLPIRPDFNDRPRQLVDFEHGKPSITRYEILQENTDGTVRIKFHPETGRTHQLRVHSAHHLGLNGPIKGDLLYGHPAERLYLHAAEITFSHPSTGKRTTIVSPPEF